MLLLPWTWDVAQGECTRLSSIPGTDIKLEGESKGKKIYCLPCSVSEGCLQYFYRETLVSHSGLHPIYSSNSDLPAFPKDTLGPQKYLNNLNDLNISIIQM